MNTDYNFVKNWVNAEHSINYTKILVEETDKCESYK